MGKTKIKTESELRRELESKCVNFNGTIDGFSAKMVINSSGFGYIVICDEHDDHITSPQYNFIPDVVPPARGEIVIDRNGKQWLSRGEFNRNGFLRVIEVDWCDRSRNVIGSWIALDRSKCSSDWNPGWEKYWNVLAKDGAE